MAHVKIWWFPVVSAIMLMITLGVIVNHQQNISRFKANSQTHTFIVDLSDDADWEQMAQITSDLQRKTHQPVYNELVDSQRNIYVIRVQAPPEEASGIWSWLTRSRKVDNVSR